MKRVKEMDPTIPCNGGDRPGATSGKSPSPLNQNTGSPEAGVRLCFRAQATPMEMENNNESNRKPHKKSQ